MTKQTKSQAATEFLLITAFFLLIMIPAVFYFYSYAQETAADVELNRASQIGSEIIYNAEQTYFYERPAQLSFDITMPQGVQNMSVACLENRKNCALIIYVLNKELTFHSNVEITASFDKNDFGQGKHKVVLKKMVDDMGEYVNITFK